MEINIPQLLVAAVFFIPLGLCVGLLLKWSSLGHFIRTFFHKAGLVKSYWRLVLVFSFLLATTYFLLFQFVPLDQRSFYLDLVGQIATLIFAIFVGYFAFLEVKRSSVEKGAIRARDYFLNDAPSRSQRARRLYEEYCKFDPSDFSNLSDLLELYLTLGGYDKEFDIRFGQLRKNVQEDWEEVIPFYLDAARSILKEDLGTARTKMAALVSLVNKNPDLLKRFTWSFKEVQSSSRYQKLAADPKKMFDNMVLYLEGDEQKKTEFEAGNYTA